MAKSLGLVAAAVLVVLLTLAGEMSFGRWANLADRDQRMQAAATAIEQLPTRFGPWRAVRDEPFSEHAVAVLECRGYINRVYENVETGESLTVSVIVGPAGPMTAHRPEVCFSTREYTQDGATVEQTVVVDGTEHQFRQAQFRSTRLEGQQVVCYYGWSHDGTWVAPEAARFVLGGQPYLVKLQFVTSMDQPGPKSPDTGGPTEAATPAVAPLGERFLQDLLPVLEAKLAGSEPPS